MDLKRNPPEKPTNKTTTTVEPETMQLPQNNGLMNH